VILFGVIYVSFCITRVSLWVSFAGSLSLFDVSQQSMMRACAPLLREIRLFSYHTGLLVGLFPEKYVSFPRNSAIRDESMRSSLE